ncbi:molybdenum cofactor guanylyltransferase MobA [Pseudooceanicola sp. MF1-13]|uniref:molybdenum cofactor guanylyltransferase MobA n=1 Tax=Pseudooceanicola sp. MF1-13 TaxID=3379095 RepID=UPI00389193A3
MNAPCVVILAGGLSRRMGGADKALQTLAGRPLIGHVMDRIAPQAGQIAVNVNRADPAYEALGVDLLADVVEDHPGPLAGILTAMRWASTDDFVITVPADAPFLPGDLIPRLMLASGDPTTTPAIAASAGRDHPVCGLWPTALAADLALAIEQGSRKVTDWTSAVGAHRAEFPATTPDGFSNVNTPDDLARAQAYLDNTA